MEKQVRRFKVKFDFAWEYGVEISKIRDDLDAIEKLGATHVDIDSYVDHDCSGIELEGYTDRLETDEEFLVRVGELKRREHLTTQRELEQLKKLKEKYD